MLTRSGFMIFGKLRLPVVVEIEPVVRSAAHVMLEPVRVVLGGSHHGRFATVAWQSQVFGEELEVRRVPVAAVIYAEAQDDRHAKCVRHLPRTHRKTRGGAKEIDGHRAIAGPLPPLP